MKILKIISKSTLIILFCVTAILLGFFVGANISDKNFKINRYSGLTKESLTDDFSKIKYQGKTPDQLTAVEAYLVAIYKLENQTHYKKTVFGEMETNIGLTQYIDLCSEKTGNDYYYAFATTSSMFSMAQKTNYTKNSNLEIFTGNPTGNTLDQVSWTEQATTYTYEEYSELIGRAPTCESSYIVSSKTIISDNGCTMENGTFTFSLTMHPILSSFSYIKEIAYRAGVEQETIKVNSLKLEFTIDSNFILISEHHTENYSFKFQGIPITLNADYVMNINY